MLVGDDVSGRAGPLCGGRLVRPRGKRISGMRFVYGTDGAAAFLQLTDDGQEQRFVFSADGRDPAETMDFLHIEPAGN